MPWVTAGRLTNPAAGTVLADTGLDANGLGALTGGSYEVLALSWASVPVDVQFVVLPWTIITEPMPVSVKVIVGGIAVAFASLPASGSGSNSGPPGDNWQYAYFTSPDSTTLTFGFSRTAQEAPNVAQAIAVRKTWPGYSTARCGLRRCVASLPSTARRGPQRMRTSTRRAAHDR